MAARMSMVVEGVILRRSVIGWIGEIHGERIVLEHLARGAYRWVLRKWQQRLTYITRGTTAKQVIADALVILAPIQRWRVVLDFGLQYHTVYVMAANRDAAKAAAEALTPERCTAVWSQIMLASDQAGPVDFFDFRATASTDTPARAA